MAEEVRKPVYWSVSAQAVNYDQVLGQMASVRWDIKDIMSQHNPYVDNILRVSPVFMTTQIDSILCRQHGQRTGMYCPHDHVYPNIDRMYVPQVDRMLRASAS